MMRRARKANRYYSNSHQLSGVLQDIVNATVKAGSGSVQDKTEEFVTDLINSTPFKKVLTKVHDQAETAVTDEVKENAIFLIAMSVAGGAIGGTIFKGPIGIIVAGGIAGIGAMQILKPTTVELTKRSESLVSPKLYNTFDQVLDALFAQRRKTVRNNLLRSNLQQRYGREETAGAAKLLWRIGQ